MRVLVLCGGESAERIVSLASGDAVASWLAQAGHEVMKYDPEQPGRLHSSDEPLAPEAIGLAAPPPIGRRGFDPSVVLALLDAIDTAKPDLVFPILHGGYGENGTLQALLDWVNMPYAGSGSLASGLAMNKEWSRAAFRAAGVPITEGFVVPERQSDVVGLVRKRIESSFGYPAVIKPLWGGSTIGLSKVHSPSDVEAAVRAVEALADRVLVEAHFTGREIAATVVADEAYPLVEIRPKEGFYDYSNKYTSGRTDYLAPAPLGRSETDAIQRAAVTAFRCLGCSGFARVDFLLGEGGRFVCLEVNTLPGMTQSSLVPKAARAKGEEPPRLMQRIIDCVRLHGA